MVRGGGRKPYRQKGTGRARQGSIRAPQFAGGGVVHGPSPRSYEQRTPKKMKAAALRGALSDRARHGRVHVVSGFVDGDQPSTKGALATLATLHSAAAPARTCWSSADRTDQAHLEEPAQCRGRAPDRLRPAQHLRRAGQRPRGVHRRTAWTAFVARAGKQQEGQQ
jgi:large subunit ribosomal protein L4